MTQLNEVYKCELCGNLVTVLETGAGALVCCGQDMKLWEEKTAEQEGMEKHVPVVSVEGNKVTVTVGSVEHPMEDAHYIEFVQLLQNGKVVAEKQFSPGDTPTAEFCLSDTEGLTAREVCNVHGLWRS